LIVYLGKGSAGLIALIRQGRWRKDEDVVFLHTGGAPALSPTRGTWHLNWRRQSQWLTFWNAGDIPCEIIEVSSPGGSKITFANCAQLAHRTRCPLLQKYELDMDSTASLICVRAFGLT